MSEPKLISPMLDNFAMGDPISDHNGVRCCPAMENDSQDKYIVKIISTPATQSQLDALLLSGAYSDKDAALAYFKTLTDGIAEEAQVLKKLSQLEGFVAYEDLQIVPMDDGNGYDVYLLSPYKRTLERYLRRHPMTHLGALNLGLDLCAALSVSRRSGYLYVDLKPSNIYITADNEFRIGDLGFLKLESLRFASLPERYRSEYTPPEVADAFSSVGTTMDVYAVGLILYQAFNDGVLPLRNDNAVFAPPAYADYEMSEIILKACAADPDARYQDPVELGQALVDYMQRNGAHDTPINPACNQETVETADIDPEYTEIITEQISADGNAQDETVDEIPEEDIITPEQIAEESIFSEDEEGNLTFLSGEHDDETSDDINSSEIDYEEVTSEVSDMLTQADDLIAHETPEPVVQPEPIDVPIPPPILPEEEEIIEEENENIPSDETESDEYSEEECEADEGEENEDTEDEKKPTHWVRNSILSLLLVAILAAGFLFYRNFYLQSIDAIILEESDKDVLTVLVSSPVDESKLTVICSDTYGNQLKSPVKNGEAVFTNLAPNSAFTVKVVIDGFHRLTGDTSAAYTTPIQTEIVQFHAVTGAEDGSVILGFTIDGPDCAQWKVLYSAQDEAQKELTFSGHMANLSGLTLGKEYTFTLQSVEDTYITGTTEVKHTASKIVKAEHLYITGLSDNKLTTQWKSPTGANVESWTVRCYNDAGFDKTIVVSEAAATFEGVDPAQSYTVEVTALGMSVSERTYAAANSIAVQDFKVDDSNPNYLKITWTPGDSAVGQNLLLLYTVDGSATHEISCDGAASAIVTPKIPGAEYAFTLQTADGSPVLGGSQIYQVAEAQSFSGYDVTAEQMEFKMCKTPSKKKWDRHDLSKSDYTTAFKAGAKASFLIKMQHKYDKSKDKITTLFVIRDEAGKIVSSATKTATWTSMWSKNYCELDIPQIPSNPGKYTIEVFFNGALANSETFTVTS